MNDYCTNTTNYLNLVSRFFSLPLSLHDDVINSSLTSCLVFIEKNHPEYKRIAIVYNNMGFVHYDQMKLNQAIDFFTKSISLCSYHVRYYLPFFLALSPSLSVTYSNTIIRINKQSTSHFNQISSFLPYLIIADASSALEHITIVRWSTLNKDLLTKLCRTLILFLTLIQECLKFGHYVDGTTFFFCQFKSKSIYSLDNLMMGLCSSNATNQFE
jgi:hypothetical protein